MKKTRMEKGITLIALIITIVVLLILAVVAISSITNEGILQYAQNAAKDYNQAMANEQQMLQQYVNFLNNGSTGSGSTGGEGSGSGTGDESGTGGTTQTVATVKNTVLSTTANTEVYDEYGNKIVVPAGFKIRVDSTTNNADTVTEGIVIEDGTNGNQFVWIPVGKIYTDTAKTEANAKTITLGRYGFDASGVASAYSNSSYTEDTVASHNSSYGNAIARDIEAFIASTDPTTGNGGYYIGRYEARTNNTTGRSSATDSLTAMTTIKTNAVYNWVTQPQASSLAQGMYPDGYKTDGTGTFSSDLINSYAWDTAIVFVQTFDNRTDKTTPYSRQTRLNTGSVETTGTTTDVICNIYDMASNCLEWSTETYSDTSNRCVARGGDSDYSIYRTSGRYRTSTSRAVDNFSFRPLIYVGL